MLKAVLFDIGGTIDTYRFTRQYRIDNIHLIRNCFERIDLRLDMSDEQLVDSIANGAAAYLRWNLQTNIELKPAEIWAQYFLRGASVTAEQLQPIGEELAFLYETRLFVREVRPEVPLVLAKIQSMGLKIGCISNTQSLNQVPHSLQAYGLLEYFDPIVLSSAYGRRKPDPSIFYYACRAASVPTSACIYVGDKISRDILGASRSGFRLAVQIRHQYDNGEKDEGAIPDAIIQNMNELVPILEAELEKDRIRACNPSSRKVKAILFDAGDVLYHRPDRDRNLNRFLNGKKLILHGNFAEERKRLKDMAFRGQMKRHDYYEAVLHLYGIDSPEELAEGVRAISLDDNTIEIMPGVPETIRQLKARGFILGIVTDTAFTFSKKLNWFDQHGFGRVWDTVISSKEIGVRKPSPDMYDKAIAQIGVRAEEAVFVGHKKTELDGARAVGLRTVAFNYEPEAVADAYIEQFQDLLTLPLLQACPDC